MAINVDIDLGYQFEVKAPFKEVFAVLSDVPTSAGFFPKVDKLTDLGGGIYRWEMEKVGTAQVNIQTVYASKYTSSKAKGTVVWTPVAGEGNALVGGSWKDDRQPGQHGARVQGQGQCRGAAAGADEDGRGAGGQGRVREVGREVHRQPDQAFRRRGLGPTIARKGLQSAGRRIDRRRASSAVRAGIGKSTRTS
jgi:hypothetical protein